MTDDISSFSSETFKVIENRRAVKHFDENHHFTDKEIEKFLSLAVLSPTSFNIQNWRFLVVKDPEIRKKSERCILGSSPSNRIFSFFDFVC